jgi:transcriptional regulator with XRE-family HTH domain
MTFGETLKRLLEEHTRSQKDLADALALDYGYLSRIVRDKADFKPSRDFILRVVKELNCTESQKTELLNEAGRLDKEIEDIAREATANPKLQELFRSLPALDDDDLEDLRRRAERLKARKESKP